MIGWFLLDDVHHLLLDGFLLQDESVFVPDEVWGLWVDAVFLHATFEETNDEAIVWVLGE